MTLNYIVTYYDHAFVCVIFCNVRGDILIPLSVRLIVTFGKPVYYDIRIPEKLKNKRIKIVSAKFLLASTSFEKPSLSYFIFKNPIDTF